MNARKILFPTDFSGPSETALRYATALARDAHATLLIVHVEEPSPAFMGDGTYFAPPALQNPELDKMLQKVVPTDKQVPFEHVLLLGTPADEIVRIAEEEKGDFIVMGTHGRTGLARLLMGSVAEAVVRRAACPVLTIKERPEAPANSLHEPAIA